MSFERIAKGHRAWPYPPVSRPLEELSKLSNDPDARQRPDDPPLARLAPARTNRETQLATEQVNRDGNVLGIPIPSTVSIDLFIPPDSVVTKVSLDAMSESLSIFRPGDRPVARQCCRCNRQPDQAPTWEIEWKRTYKIQKPKQRPPE